MEFHIKEEVHVECGDNFIKSAHTILRNLDLERYTRKFRGIKDADGLMVWSFVLLMFCSRTGPCRFCPLFWAALRFLIQIRSMGVVEWQ